ncbi:putative Active breakpoint cluster region-related protein [Daphnia magna]|uniref:Putative Active breakpoint cluster region-related protein n=1 Tax=Daphnia magna TaxID=35525 RepID=A0A0P5TLH6_9CRUS|nr:putative Active breakpoint cluster region-related protein [Daphnia magna]
MNEFSDFCKAWKLEFPGEDLPTVWEEDTRANLLRHKKNLDYLKSEVRKEEFYVKFLESVLSNAENRKQQVSPNLTETLTGGLLTSQALATEKPHTASSDSDFVTVISIINKLENSQEQSKQVVERPKAPPKPLKHYTRSVSTPSDSPSKVKPEDLIAWTKQQIQQLQTKPTPKHGASSASPPLITAKSISEIAADLGSKRRISYENVKHPRADYENVLGNFPSREPENVLSNFPNREPENGDLKRLTPITDMDSDQGAVLRNVTLFENSKTTLPPVSPCQPNELCDEDTFYDSVPQEENVSYIDAENYIYLLDKPDEIDDREIEAERNGTLKSFSSTISDDSSSTGSLRRRLYANLSNLDDLDLSRPLTAKQQLVLQNFFDSEENYVGALNVVLHYSKALTAALMSSQPVLTKEEIACIFFHIPQLHFNHSEFLQNIKSIKLVDSNLIQVVQLLKSFSENVLPEYGIFLSNFKEALETTRRACQHSTQFADLVRRIKLRSSNQQMVITLDELLHKPVARIQRHVAVIQDLLDVSGPDEPAYGMLQEVQLITKTFLSEFSTNQLQSLFPAQTARNHPVTQSSRHLVKNGFLVELQPDGKRKQRHCFLFTDLIVCTKYKGNAGNLEIKWYLPLAQVSVSTDDSAAKLNVSALTNVASLRSQAAAARTQLERSSAGSDRQRKKLACLEAKLLLDSPNLPLKFSYKPKGACSKSSQSFTFLLSSEFERTLWVEATETLRRNIERLPVVYLQPEEVETHIKACRTAVEPLVGLMKSLAVQAIGGELQVVVHSLLGLSKHCDVYVVFELDSYGHYFHKARTRMAVKSLEPRWEEDFHIDLEGARGMRILLYEEDAKQTHILRGKAELELSGQWLKSLNGPQYIPLTNQFSTRLSSAEATPDNDLTLCLSFRYISHDVTLRRPALRGTSSNIFGVPIEEVCHREKRSIPLIITCCVREVERRGLEELGIYRVSGLATDIAKLRKTFDTRGLESDAILKDVDINSTSGLLKLYLRQLPEALFTDRLYPHFLQAFSTLDVAASMSGVEDITSDGGARTLTILFSSLPQLNQTVILYLLDHLVRVNSKEVKNKMSLHNLATVFGPTLLRPAPTSDTPDSLDQLAMGTIDVMAQAGILHFFLLRRARRLPIQFPTA